MILNLRDRAYVNKFAREVGELKNETVKAGNAYMDLYHEASAFSCHFVFPEFTMIAFSDMKALTDMVDNGKVWCRHFCNTDPTDLTICTEPFNALTIASICNYADQIAKHLKNIRSFQPNALEQAKDRPTRIKKNVEKLIFDVNAFSNMENKALGKAKALITLVKFIRILASD